MALQTASGTGPRRAVRGRPMAMALGGTILTVGLLVGFRIGRQTHHAPTAAPAATLSEPASPVVSPPRVTALPVPVLYVVNAPEQADWVRRFTYELGQVSGQPVAVGAVVLADTVDAAALESLPHAPGTRIYDLR